MAEQAEHSERGITVEEYKRAEAKMRKMIEDGKAKPEDVERRLIEMRKMIGGQSTRGGERRRISREDYGRAEAELRKAVAEGKVSEEDARTRLQGMRKMMAEPSRDVRAEYAGFERRILAAVEAGKMTGEKLEAYRKRMGQER